MWPVTIKDFGICYMLNVYVRCYLNPVVELLFTLSGTSMYLR